MFTHSLTRHRREARAQHAVFGIVAVASMGLIASCSGASGTDYPNIEIGKNDRPDNGVIAVDEAKVSGSIADHTLRLEIPLSTTGSKDAQGALDVRVVDVTGVDVLSSTKAAYSV